VGYNRHVTEISTVILLG